MRIYKKKNNFIFTDTKLDLEELIPNTVDAALEKHVPSYSTSFDKINVVIGASEHPMTEEHYIEWILIETNKSFRVTYLKPHDEPKTSYVLEEGEELINIYAYCNLHGLWSIAK